MKTKKMSGPVMVYWLIATAIYLAWSFTTNDWDRTWIIWPVVGVFIPGVLCDREWDQEEIVKNIVE